MWLAIIVGSLILAEFYGYWLHVLLHSYWIPALSRSHMNHHVLSYAPGSRMRHEDYVQEVQDGDVLIFGLGLEWILPSLVLLVVTVSVEWLIGFSPAQIAVSVGIVIAYSVFLFWFLHETLHLKHPWILRIKPVRRWYLNARKLHDIHHHHVTDEGLMNRNYGIAFFVFDKVFGSFLPKLKGGINRDGIAAAKEKLRKNVQ